VLGPFPVRNVARQSACVTGSVRCHVLSWGAWCEHAFVDETKEKTYVIAAAILNVAALDRTRSTMRAQLLRGQSHLHFVREKPARRGQILSAILACGVVIDIYDASGCDPRKAREVCLKELVGDLAQARAQHLVIERDDSLLKVDQRVLYSAVRGHQVQDTLAYRHEAKRSEPLLWIADAAAWCWTHPDWRQRLAPIVRNIRTLG
jgi:hypothetical protein